MSFKKPAELKTCEIFASGATQGDLNYVNFL